MYDTHLMLLFVLLLPWRIFWNIIYYQIYWIILPTAQQDANCAVWPEKIAKCPQKLPQNDSTTKFLTTLQKLPKNVRDLGKIIVAKGIKKLLKVQKSPNLVTLKLG